MFKVFIFNGVKINFQKIAIGLIIFLGACAPKKNNSSLKEAVLTDNYRIVTELEVLKPVDIANLNNDAQSAEILQETEKTVKARITIDPTKDQLTDLVPISSWYEKNQSNQEMKKYLEPGITTNWDEPLRQQILKDLKASGIDVDQLNDVEVVKKVSSWLFDSGKFPFEDLFVSYDVEFNAGKPVVISELRERFEKVKNEYKLKSDEEVFEKGIFGKGIYNWKRQGNCTMSATLQATVLKAIGIPTRIVLFVPAVDPTDSKQLKQVFDNINNAEVRTQLLQGFGAVKGQWASHTFNEVFIGNKWVRLNYSSLGQTPLSNVFMGLLAQTHVMSDWADYSLAKTWGVQASGNPIMPDLSNVNAYRSHAIYEIPKSLSRNNDVKINADKIVSRNDEKVSNALWSGGMNPNDMAASQFLFLHINLEQRTQNEWDNLLAVKSVVASELKLVNSVSGEKYDIINVGTLYNVDEQGLYIDTYYIYQITNPKVLEKDKDTEYYVVAEDSQDTYWNFRPKKNFKLDFRNINLERPVAMDSNANSADSNREGDASNISVTEPVSANTDFSNTATVYAINVTKESDCGEEVALCVQIVFEEETTFETYVEIANSIVQKVNHKLELKSQFGSIKPQDIGAAITYVDEKVRIYFALTFAAEEQAKIKCGVEYTIQLDADVTFDKYKMLYLKEKVLYFHNDKDLVY